MKSLNNSSFLCKVNMIFDTFLNRFELRTGCFVIAIMNLLFIIISLHVPMIADFDMDSWMAIVAAIERLFEFLCTLVLIYGIFQKSRVMMLIWQMLLPITYLFNVGYYCYLSFALENLKWLSAMVFSLYLNTYSLMLINSHYDELGYIEDYMRDVAYIQSRNMKKTTLSYTRSTRSKSEDERVVKITRRTAT